MRGFVFLDGGCPRLVPSESGCINLTSVESPYISQNGLCREICVCAAAENTFSNTLQVRPCKLNCLIPAADGLRKYFRLRYEVLHGVKIFKNTTEWVSSACLRICASVGCRAGTILFSGRRESFPGDLMPPFLAATPEAKHGAYTSGILQWC